MKFLRKLFGSRNIDPTLGDAALKRAMDALERGDFEPARAQMASAGTSDRRQFVFNNLQSVMRGEPLATRAWREAYPNESDGYLAGGAHAIIWAWEARGTGFADTVSQQAAETFMQRLSVADRLLEAASELAPNDPLPLAERLTIDRATGRAQEGGQRFARITELDPTHVGGHLGYFEMITAKWGGSDEALFAFARQTLERHPTSGNLAILIVQAHQEVVGMLAAQNEHELADKHLAQPEVKAEFIEAFDRTFATLATPNPAFTPDALTPRSANIMMDAMSDINDPERALMLYGWLDGRITLTPWTRYQAGPEAAFQDFKNWLQVP